MSDDDPLDRLRDVRARQAEHLEQYGVLYDAPAVEPDDLAWAIAEIERLRRTTTGDYRDHDHETEAAVDLAFDNPTPDNILAAQVAVALLQRRYDHVLRRLDGHTEPPKYPVHRHNPAEHPEDCLGAVLHELAGAQLDDRAETLAHGLEALHALANQLESARGIARWCYRGLSDATLTALGDTTEWPWLQEE